MQNTMIAIATGPSRNTRVWRNKQISWEALVKRLTTSQVSVHTLKEYHAMSKDDQAQVKDSGGYVGGYLQKGKRSPRSVGYRQLITLDLDFANTDFFEDFKMLYDCAAVIHSTFKHTAAEPRYRLIVPLDRECAPEEYVAIARKMAGVLGIDQFDNTTFEIHRFMYWPANPKDADFYSEQQEGPFLCADAVLASYQDWRDSSLWPTADKRMQEIGEAAKKQEDPYTKRGVIGAFCRTYTVQEAMAAFLDEVYSEGADGRYTYIPGTTSSGVVVYEDTFSFSHHGTDPAGGQLCNAFDLVRIHKFGHLDIGEKSDKSRQAAEQFALQIGAVKRTIALEKAEEAKAAFGELFEELTEEDLEWMKQLKLDTKGTYLSTAQNINLIMQNDRFMKDAFRYNEFDARRYLFNTVPWRYVTSPEPERNVDYSGVRNYIECMYGISAQSKIEDSLTLEAERNSYHPIREYLTGQQWDGLPRIDTLLIEYFGARDNIYTREAMRVWLIGAIARVMEPGVKFDYVLVLVDPEQGIGKSSFFRMLGKEWFSDTFTTVNGVQAFEQLQGAWIIEMAELAGLRKQEVEPVKHFIGKQRDQYRAAYGRTVEVRLRQCVFGGTTNRQEFLQDPSGDRRFMPIDVRRDYITRNVMTEFESEIDQVWAEAMHLYLAGEKLVLSKAADRIAFEEQVSHRESDGRAGLIIEFLDQKLPENWHQLDIFERSNFLRDGKEGEVRRNYVCAAEIWCECLGKNKEEFNKYATKEINDIMRAIPGWRFRLSTRKFEQYGVQRFYERIRIS